MDELINETLEEIIPALNVHIPKPVITQAECDRYSTIAEWCNNNNAHIEDKGEYYEVVANEVNIPTVEEIKANLLQAVDRYLNSTVQAKGYDSILSACSYAFDTTDEIFAEEGKKCLAWRSSVYRKCYDILADVEQGKRNIPTEEELLAELPKLEW